MPDEFVWVVSVVDPLTKNLPDAPDEGAVKTTLTPETGLSPESTTVTLGGTYTLLIGRLCGVVFAFANMLTAAPLKLVSEKLTVVSPGAVAETL